MDLQQYGLRGVEDVSDIQDAGHRRLFEGWMRAAETGLARASAFDPLDYLDTAKRWTLLDVIDGGADFRLRFQGPDVVGYIGIEATGRLISEVSDQTDPKLLSRMAEMLSKALESGRPVLNGPQKSTITHKDWIIVSSITLPLSDTGETLDRILIAATYDRGATG